MNQTIKEVWLAALRGGEYEQATGSLRDAGSFCCLGVLCDLHAKETGLKWDQRDPTGSFYYLNELGVLPDEVMSWAGLVEDDPYFEGVDGCIHSLVEMNDDGLDFKTIADSIEKYL